MGKWGQGSVNKVQPEDGSESQVVVDVIKGIDKGTRGELGYVS